MLIIFQCNCCLIMLRSRIKNFFKKRKKIEQKRNKNLLQRVFPRKMIWRLVLRRIHDRILLVFTLVGLFWKTVLSCCGFHGKMIHIGNRWKFPPRVTQKPVEILWNSLERWHTLQPHLKTHGNFQQRSHSRMNHDV